MKKIFCLFLGVLMFLNAGLSCNASDSKGYFTDVSQDQLYYSSIESLYELDVIKGYDDGTFRPDNFINRAEFLKIVMDYFNLIGYFKVSISGTNCFGDVKDQWFAGYVCSAHENGVVGGYKNGIFKPQSNISLAEASKIIYNFRNLSKGQDAEVSDPWYKKYIEDLAEKKALPFTITGFDHLLTRAEMAEIVLGFVMSSAGAGTGISLSYDDLVFMSKLSAKANFAYRFQKFYGHQLATDGVPDGIDYKTFKRIMLGTSACGFNADGSDGCELVESELYRDANRIYNYPPDSFDHKLMILENADAKTFQVYPDILTQFAFDKNHLYMTDKENPFYHESGDVPSDLINVYENIFKDDLYVYYFDFNDRKFIKMDSVDVTTFVAYQSTVAGMFADKDHLYIYEEPALVQLNLDKDSFEVLYSSEPYGSSGMASWVLRMFKDKNGVYYYSSDVEDLQQVAGADPETFKIRSVNEGIIANDKNAFYMVDSSGKLTKNTDIDVASFIEVPTHGEGFEYVISYVKDKNKVYSAVGLESIVWADPKTFEVYGYEIGFGMDSANFIYGKSGDNLWVINKDGESILNGADFGTFKILGDVTFQLHFKKGDADITNYHYTDHEICISLSGEIMDNNEELEMLEDGTCMLKISDIIDDDYDIAIDSFIAKDNSHVWKYDDESKSLKELDYVDVQSFEKVEYAVFKDKNNVYLPQGEDLEVIEGADPDTFGLKEFEGGYYFFDKNSVWEVGSSSFTKIDDADPETFF